MQIIDINNEYYPDKLRDISEPPQKLYVLGDVSILSKNSIAIIGSRKCNKKKKNQGTKFAYGLAKEGLTIVSGMAERNRYISTYRSIKSRRTYNCNIRFWF